jgi:hypothetical protein
LIPEEERAFMTKPDFLEKVAPLDPLVWLRKLDSRTFRLQESAFVRSTPQASRDRLRSVLPASAVTVSYHTQQDFQGVAEEGKLLEWIKSQLRETSATDPGRGSESGPGTAISSTPPPSSR